MKAVHDPPQIHADQELTLLGGHFEKRAGEFAANLDALSTRHSGAEAGDPARAAKALLDLVKTPAPPLRLLLGNMAFDVVTLAHRRQLEEWNSLERVARLADG
jgi:hypothetical protein